MILFIHPVEVVVDDNRECFVFDIKNTFFPLRFMMPSIVDEMSSFHSQDFKAYRQRPVDAIISPLYNFNAAIRMVQDIGSVQSMHGYSNLFTSGRYYISPQSVVNGITAFVNKLNQVALAVWVNDDDKKENS